MNDFTKQLNARPSKIRNAPLRFDGHFGDFFDVHVLPNLPTKERVLEFDERLERYLSGPRPYHLARKVSFLDTKKTYRTNEVHLLLASDNSPAWWLHAFLLSDLPFPSDMGEFLFSIPRHMFDIKLGNQMNKAGFHLAHLSNAKNGHTKWNDWNKEELERWTRLNIHPWNCSLISKKNWPKYGADQKIIGFIHHAYTELYGSPYIKWRVSHPIGSIWDGLNIPYSYGSVPEDNDQQVKVIRVGITIWSKFIGTNLTLSLKLSLGNYHIPHDDLIKWAKCNTNALKTRSWIEGEIYHWPKPSKKMAVFLEDYRVD